MLTRNAYPLQKGEECMKKLLSLFVLVVSPCLAADPKSEWSAWDSKLYDENSKQQYDASLEHLSKYDFSSRPELQLIVELGCNTANVSNKLALQHPEKTFVGIDLEEGAIELAQQKHAETQNLKLICNTAQKFNLEESGSQLADLIACYHVLHWIKREELESVFENIAANLAPGGILDLSSSAKQETRDITKAIRWTLIKPKWWGTLLTKFLPQFVAGETKLTLLTAPELEELATTAGLKVETCEESEACFSFNLKHELNSWLHTILKPHGIESMEQQDRDEFVNEVVNLYCRDYNPAAEAGKIEYQFTILKLIAHKPAKEPVE